VRAGGNTVVNQPKRALLVGIDDYPDALLTGCVDDAARLRDKLAVNEDGSPNFDCALLTSDATEVTRQALRRALLDLFRNCRGQDLLFFFAGHGAQTPWGAELVTQDYAPDSLGVSMADVLLLANSCGANEVVLILDCCNAGELGDLAAFRSARDGSLAWSPAVINEGVTIIASSGSGEASREREGHGRFTHFLVQGLDGGAADLLGEITSQSLFVYAARPFGAWDQRPVFKSHVSEPSVVRTTKPRVDRAILRALPRYFVGSPSAQITLDPDYEGEGRPLPQGDHGTEKQQAFDHLKALRDAGLVQAEGGQDLFFAAMRGGKVSLTPIGQTFWQLADEGRL
jgi:hypothetical protein